MASNMVYDLFEAVFAYHVILYAVRGWLPFEMVEAIIIIIGRLPTRKQQQIRISLIVACLKASTLLQYTSY
jgi:hypothetical protein